MCEGRTLSCFVTVVQGLLFKSCDGDVSVRGGLWPRFSHVPVQLIEPLNDVCGVPAPGVGARRPAAVGGVVEGKNR